MIPSEQPTSKPASQGPGDSTRPGPAMTMRTYRVRPDGTRTDHTPIVVVSSSPQSALEATPGLPPCRCPRCKPQGKGATP